MGLDFEKLRSLQDKLNQQFVKEIYDDLSEEFIHFTNSEIVNYHLNELKFTAKNKQSSRVLNSWINSDILFVQEEDKGKNRRFDRLEIIWLNIIIEARKFGIPLDALKQTRRDLLQSPIENFSFLKFSVLGEILGISKVLMIYEDGYVNILSVEAYSKTFKNAVFPAHLNFRLLDFIKTEFPNNSFHQDFLIQDVYNSEERMTLLYFLKTGDYKSIKIFLEEGDVRLVENSNLLIHNKKLLEVISSWTFKKIEINVNDELKLNINP